MDPLTTAEREAIWRAAIEQMRAERIAELMRRAA